MKLKEILVNKKYEFKGKIIKVRNDIVLLPNGKEAKREIVEHPGGVGILAIDNDEVVLVNQYRYAFQKEILEIPAGKLEKGENPQAAAYRELSEEVGIEAKRIIDLGSFYPTVGYCEEEIHLFLAKNLVFKKNHPDDDEFVEIVRMKISELLQKIKNKEIKDGKTIVAILKYMEFERS